MFLNLSYLTKGAGHAAYIAKLRYKVRGSVPISGPEDTNATCSWISSDTFTTPRYTTIFLTLKHILYMIYFFSCHRDRFISFAHEKEDSIGSIRANWAALNGGSTKDCERDVGTATDPSSWSGACNLLTHVAPAINITKRPEHCSTAVDVFTPKSKDGRALYALDVWPWLITTTLKRTM